MHISRMGCWVSVVSGQAAGRTRLGPNDDAFGLPNQDRLGRYYIPPKPDSEEPTCHTDTASHFPDSSGAMLTDPSCLTPSLTSFLNHSSPDLWGETG